MTTYRRLLRYTQPYVWPRGVLAIAFMLGYSALESSVPFVVKYTFDQVFTEQRSMALSLAVMAVIALGMLRGVLGFGSAYLTDWIGQRVITDLRNELTAHMQTLDLSFFNKQRAGQIVSRVTADVTLVRNAVTDAVKSVFQDTTTLVCLCIVAIYMDPVLAVLGLLLFPIAFVPTRYFSTQLRLTSRKQQEATGRLNAMLHENVQGNRVVKVFGQEGFESSRLRAQDERIFQLFMRASRIRSLPVTEVLAGLAIAVIIWYGGSSVIGGTRTQGDFIAFIIALALAYEPFKKLVRRTTRSSGASRARSACSSCSTDRSRRTPGRECSTAAVPDRVRRRLVRVRPGEAGAAQLDLRSPSARRRARRHERRRQEHARRPDPALLRRDRRPHHDRRPRHPRRHAREPPRHIAVVSQFTFLFNDTVRANIAYGEPRRPPRRSRRRRARRTRTTSSPRCRRATTPDRRPRRAPVGRPAPAARDRRAMLKT